MPARLGPPHRNFFVESVLSATRLSSCWCESASCDLLPSFPS